MDSVIARIVELDQQAQSIKEKINAIENTNNEKLKKTLKELETQIIKEAKKIGDEKYQELLNEGIHHKKRISEETSKECDRLEKTFQNKYKNLTNDIFNNIFKV